MLKIVRSYTITFFMLFAAGALAATHESCDRDMATIKQQMTDIHQQLKETKTRSEYEVSVKGRFEAVDKLLLLSNQCIKKGGNSAGDTKQWYQIKMTLASLQASAQVSAFTKFDDWLTAKELDLSAFENARMNNW